MKQTKPTKTKYGNKTALNVDQKTDLKEDNMCQFYRNKSQEVDKTISPRASFLCDEFQSYLQFMTFAQLSWKQILKFPVVKHHGCCGRSVVSGFSNQAFFHQGELFLPVTQHTPSSVWQRYSKGVFTFKRKINQVNDRKLSLMTLELDQPTVDPHSARKQTS